MDGPISQKNYLNGNKIFGFNFVSPSLTFSYRPRYVWTILSCSHAYVHSMCVRVCVCVCVCVRVCVCVCVWVCVRVKRGRGRGRGNSSIAVHILLRDPLSKSTWLASLEALETIFSRFLVSTIIFSPYCLFFSLSVIFSSLSLSSLTHSLSHSLSLSLSLTHTLSHSFSLSLLSHSLTLSFFLSLSLSLTHTHSLSLSQSTWIFFDWLFTFRTQSD